MRRFGQPLWTVTVLTIPQRERHLAQLFESLCAIRVRRPWELLVVYNWDSDEDPQQVERRLRRLGRGLPLVVHFNTHRPTIGGGRAQQLALCKSPLIAFLDDDLTVHGDFLGVLEQALRRLPLGAVGLPSYVGDTNELFKPQATTPSVDAHGIRFSSVQGMLVAGYRRLFRDLGGFNPRRAFWGEWTELNLRLWRSGYPTGYVMDGAFTRDWRDAPESPTRNKPGREDHVLWGLLCTALEYDAIEPTEATERFWSLVEERYLAYSFDGAPAPRDLLASVLRLVPRLAVEWPHIAEFRARAREHPFLVPPFHELTAADVASTLAYAERHIGRYRDVVWAPPSRAPARGWIQRIAGAVRWWMRARHPGDGLDRRARQPLRSAQLPGSARKPSAPGVPASRPRLVRRALGGSGAQLTSATSHDGAAPSEKRERAREAAGPAR